MADYLDWAIKVSRKRFKASSRAVYQSMWNGFESRLAEQGASPGTQTIAQLQKAIEEAGDYLTQKRLHALVKWVFTTLATAGVSLQDQTEDLDRLYLADDRATHRALGVADFDALIQAAEASVRGWKGVRLAAMVALLTHAGLRQQELLALNRQALKWLDHGELELSVGKSAAERTIRLPAPCAVRVQAWLTAYPAPDDCPWLFVADPQGSPMDPSTVWRQLRRLGAHALVGNDKLSTGVLRASLAHQLQQQGADTEAVRSFLGHRLEASTAELLERVVPGS